MRFRVIEGGRGRVEEPAGDPESGYGAPTADDVRREAERRLHLAGWGRWQDRRAATGCAIPRELQYLAMQITYVADAIVRLAKIPVDFRSDVYWPNGMARRADAQNCFMMT
jgi:hypothetical protein